MDQTGCGPCADRSQLTVPGVMVIVPASTVIASGVRSSSGTQIQLGCRAVGIAFEKDDPGDGDICDNDVPEHHQDVLRHHGPVAQFGAIWPVGLGDERE